MAPWDPAPTGEGGGAGHAGGQVGGQAGGGPVIPLPCFLGNMGTTRQFYLPPHRSGPLGERGPSGRTGGLRPPDPPLIFRGLRPLKLPERVAR